MNFSLLNRTKQQIRRILVDLNLPLTRNLKYDILTKKILARELNKDSSCVDVGAHKGEILDVVLALAPHGKHTAFEPIPSLHTALLAHYSGRVSIHPFALSNRSGNMLFNLVVDEPAYSGLQRRTYKSTAPKIETIEVEVRMLDEVLRNRDFPIRLIKIDVEGGELDVLKGATAILTADKPLLIFEFGKGASEYYGTMPHHMLEFLEQHQYSIWTLSDFWQKKSPLKGDQLKTIYEEGSDYYFVAGFNQ